jgi:NAD(P) transhydrogenase subunit beta
MSGTIILIYVLTAICFILALKGLSSPTTARHGNIVGIMGMALAISTTLFYLSGAPLPSLKPGAITYALVAVGVVLGGGVGTGIALRIQMKSMPQLVAAFHSLVGLAAVLIAAAAFYAPQSYGIGTPGDIRLESLIEMGLGSAIGAITFTGSVVAFSKLQGLVSGAPAVFKGQHLVNLLIGLVIIALIVCFTTKVAPQALAFWAVVALSLVVGVTLIIPIGGADMPVVISMLNSYSGWAAAGIGFTLNNPLLGGYGTGEGAAAPSASGAKGAKAGSAEDAAFILQNAQSVIIVPGYGMAVAKAQHAVKELYDLLTQEGINVRFAIHPVAGRMPGHMNVLLAEANIPYDVVFELEQINSDFAGCDVAYVIGANDVTNPAARQPGSPIFGMPILEVDKAKTVFFIKRSLSPGYAGIDNKLFYADNTMMLFADAKKMTEDIVRALH